MIRDIPSRTLLIFTPPENYGQVPRGYLSHPWHMKDGFGPRRVIPRKGIEQLNIRPLPNPFQDLPDAQGEQISSIEVLGRIPQPLFVPPGRSIATEIVPRGRFVSSER